MKIVNVVNDLNRRSFLKWTTAVGLPIVAGNSLADADGGDDFVARCFNAVCRINAIVDGDAWEVTKEGGRVVLEPTWYEWVRWCQGEVFCE